MYFLSIDHIEKSFDQKRVLDQFSLEILPGEIVVLLGPSGCGKTTLLRIIAGLEQADAGRLFLEKTDLTPIPIHQRGFGMVFQDYALFPHKNVAENVAFGLRMNNWSRKAIGSRVETVLALVGLTGFDERRIHELSGGEQQRVALARALAPAPRLLLLDEPLGALDRTLRERLMADLRTILKEAGHRLARPYEMTAIYVTHDQAEAFAIADRVVVLRHGRIEQQGSPESVYRQPANPFVAQFLGMNNLLQAEIVSAYPLRVLTPLGMLELDRSIKDRLPPGQPVQILVRPDAGRPGNGAIATNTFTGKVSTVTFHGRYQTATLQIGEPESQLKLEFDSSIRLPSPGSDFVLTLDSSKIQLLESG